MTTSLKSWRTAAVVVGFSAVTLALFSFARGCGDAGASTADTALAEATAPSRGTDPVIDSAVRTTPLRFVIDEGRFVAHDVHFSLDESAHAFASKGGETRVMTTIAGRVRLDGQKAAHVGESAARLSFTDVTTLRVVVNGQEAVDDAARAAFGQSGARVVFSETGKPLSIAPEEGAHELFVRLAQIFVAHTSLRFAADDGRTFASAQGTQFVVEEAIPDGVLVADYVMSNPSKKTVDVVRTARQVSSRVPGADVDAHPVVAQGHDRATIHSRGVVLSRDADLTRTIRGTDGGEIASSHLQLRMTLVDEGASDVIVGMYDPAMAPEALLLNAERARDVQLRQRIEGLTRAELVDTVRGAAQSGTAPDHNRFLWRATGLLRADDGALAALEPIFVDEQTGLAGRALMLDLAVGAGTPAAQETVLAWLESEHVARSANASALRQRLTFVSRPTEKTLAFLVDKSTQAGPWQEPARMSLGAASGHLARAGRGDEADTLARTLLALPTDNARAEAVLVKAIGNSGRPVVEGRILKAAVSGDADLRHAAAGALRHLHTPGTRKALLSLMTDESPLIAARAMASMSKQPPLSAEERSILAAAVSARRIPGLALAELVTLLAPLVDDALVREMLRSVLSIERLEDPNIKARIRALLQEHPQP
jgi:hypothetical protein